MNTKPRIKVIKRGEQQPKSVLKAVKTQTQQSTAREMVATVTDWVTEFQQKSRKETQEALHKLLSQTPNLGGCTNC